MKEESKLLLIQRYARGVAALTENRLVEACRQLTAMERQPCKAWERKYLEDLRQRLEAM